MLSEPEQNGQQQGEEISLMISVSTLLPARNKFSKHIDDVRLNNALSV